MGSVPAAWELSRWSPRSPRRVRARRNDLDGDERWATITGEEGGWVGFMRAGYPPFRPSGYLPPADRRPSKVISKAFNAAFQRLDQRFCPAPVGSRLISAR
jgi:hypothetical protein